MTMLIDKQKVANSFSRAAGTYDSVAELQRDIGNKLIDFLPKSVPQRVLDLGCGTGYFSSKLNSTYPGASLLNLDLALGMLRFAREHRSVEQAHWICGDAEALPLANDSIDVIFSSLAIQWCEDLPALFNEILRVLSPGGYFVFATLGPDTLKELRQAWQQADSFTHVNRFLSLEQHLSALPESLVVEEIQEEERVLRYRQLKELTDELKRLGAHNMNAGQQTGLTGRERVKRFKAAYEQQRLVDGAIPATYQVFYAVLHKPLEE